MMLRRCNKLRHPSSEGVYEEMIGAARAKVTVSLRIIFRMGKCDGKESHGVVLSEGRETTSGMAMTPCIRVLARTHSLITLSAQNMLST